MTILFNPGFVPVDGNGNPYAGAKLYFYVTGTTTLQNTYSDSALSSANTNPVVADANGLFSAIYLDPTLTYKAVLKTSADVTIWTRDPIGGPSGIPVIQTFSASGTYTPTAGMVKAIIECWGGGGGGGGSASAAASFHSYGGGGGAGGYSRKIVTKATVGASQAVTIGAAGTAGSAGNNAGGAGGDTSVGSLCIGKGGSGGGGSNGTNATAGGAGGVAGTGDVTAVGEDGTSGTSIGTSAYSGVGACGVGGSSALGSGGNRRMTAPQANGVAGTGFASGGGGGSSTNAGSTQAGGAGAAGYVIITEYIG